MNHENNSSRYYLIVVNTVFLVDVKVKNVKVNINVVNNNSKTKTVIYKEFTF